MSLPAYHCPGSYYLARVKPLRTIWIRTQTQAQTQTQTLALRPALPTLLRYRTTTERAASTARRRQPQSITTPHILSHESSTVTVTHRSHSRSPCSSRHFSTTARTMSNSNPSSDAAYLSFLDKANQDTTTSTAQQEPQQGQGFHASKTVDADQRQRVPRVLQDVQVYYVSDSDEPFEPVVLSWRPAADSKWPGEEGKLYLTTVVPVLYVCLYLILSY